MTSAAPARKPYRKAPPQHREVRHTVPTFREDLGGTAPAPAAPQPEPSQDSLCDADRIKILQQQNEDLRRRLTHTTHKMEAMETEFQSSRHFMQAEIGRTKDDLEKMRDKFRRLQNSYTASQRANQDLEEKLHALLRKVERDKKTMDQEIVELTNKLLDAKNTIDKLEELNERYRQDCNLAVQLLKCNKSHFRNHKFADLPYELQDMVNKHMKSSLPEKGAHSQDADSLSLTPADVVPTSVIARVLEKPEPLVLNSAQSSSSAGRPVAEDVFVHVDMTGPQAEGGRENGGQGVGRSDPQLLQQNGMCRSQSSLDGQSGEEGGPAAPSFEKLNPYPTPPPPHPLYPGRKVIEFSSDDKVKIPKNSPLPNCTYATRQAISLSLVQNEEEAGDRQRTVPNSPAVSDGGWRSGASSSSGGHPRGPPQPDLAEPLSSQSSPFSSPPQAPSAFASSGSSEEDLLANWQRMFVEKVAPSSEGMLVNRTSFSSETVKDLERSRNGKAGRDRRVQRGAYSDGEESSPQSWTASRESSLDTDTSSADLRTRKGQYGGDFSQEESERLLMSLDPLDDGDSCDTAVTVATALDQTSPATKRKEYVDVGSAGSSTEERDILPQDFPVITPRVLAGLEDFVEKPPPHAQTGPPTSSRPQKSPKRMGVHHLHRKDSLTRAQEHGNLLD
ncbi:tight junction-associated protein 1 [Megalops cyprinoides]|uniref:tight junction-associated protein 1 n=1 Tax=Megalops cyprinoides TaxID=118141 RepID=UPI001864C317|nr:tight junction-associated protein 1 [Megalops cyprinoides]XP_036402172.1 tight junction-associated protein 1 [Megalops cyprinoides]